MSESERGQVISSAAEIYDEFFVPALFGEWPSRIIETAGIAEGDSVLDVACGTGVLGIAAADIVGESGSVTAIDINEGMLSVARAKDDRITWDTGAAESIPFETGSFDHVVSQFGLMFFEDQVKALSEMYRVTKPGGTLTVAVWDSLENTPGYRAVVRMLDRLFGTQAADALRYPYSLGETGKLERLFETARIPDLTISTVDGRARFPSIKSWMFTDVKGWTLANIIDDEQYQELLREAEKDLSRFVNPLGEVEFAHPAHIASARKSQAS